MASADEILAFWFGAPGDPERGRPRQPWFAKDPAFDAEIARRFGALLDQALAGALHAWRETASSALALIVVCDQFPRNIHRGTPRAFAWDALALDAARHAVRHGYDQRMVPVERWFVYLPFEHSESLADQDEAVRLFEQLRGDADSASAIDYAHRHRDVIRRYGRFPHRNAILGRASTAEELEYLAQPGSGF
jgi:uncharacterized protein (DUF924 family)